MTETREHDQTEPEPNTQLSPYGQRLRARFELALKHTDAVLPPAFARWFRTGLAELVDRDWNYFGSVDSLIANGQIPYVNDVLRSAEKQGLLSDDEKRLVAPEVSA